MPIAESLLEKPIAKFAWKKLFNESVNKLLQSNRPRFNQNEVDPTCQLCYAESETLTHFLLKCRNLETVRKHIQDKFNTVLKDIITVFPDAAKYTLVQLLVDCGVILQEDPEYKHTNIISLLDFRLISVFETTAMLTIENLQYFHWLLLPGL